jgi:hypothetical protein
VRIVRSQCRTPCKHFPGWASFHALRQRFRHCLQPASIGERRRCAAQTMRFRTPAESPPHSQEVPRWLETRATSYRSVYHGLWAFLKGRRVTVAPGGEFGVI